MKLDRKTQIPNLVVYVVLYAILFGISIWLLIVDKESPTNWMLYVGMIWAVLGGLVKFIVHSRKKHSQAAQRSQTSC
jgi:uncharacterized membrane protein YdjX (TVP38/TMEM64 family)